MWVEAGFPPETFWQQTERSFSNALLGAARRDIRTAWQSAIFTGAASVGKLRDIDEYLPDIDPRPAATPGAMKTLGFLMKLQRKGIPMKIERVERLH